MSLDHICMASLILGLALFYIVKWLFSKGSSNVRIMKSEQDDVAKTSGPGPNSRRISGAFAAKSSPCRNRKVSLKRKRSGETESSTKTIDKATNTDCGAKSSFCGTLQVSKIKTRSGTRLDERIDEEIVSKIGKNQKRHISKECKMDFQEGKKNKKQKGHVFLEGGGGQSSFSIARSSHMLFRRDYPQMVNFDGKNKIGVFMVPAQVIPKYYGINLYPEQTEDAIVAADRSEDHKKLADELRKAQHSEIGDVPEKDAFSGLEIAFRDALAALVIHSLDLCHPDLKPGSQEFDFYALHADSLTVFVVEVKKKLGNYIADKKDDLTIAEKAHEQLQRAKRYIEEWFGADLCDDWMFKPIIFCHQVSETILPLCHECDKGLVVKSKKELISIIRTHIDTHERTINARHIEDFKLMARYLLFGISARILPTAGRFGEEVARYMKKAGSWDSILLWCFLTPGQMEVLSLPKLVFYAGWGGGKTITGIEACKLWSKEGKVLILVNGFDLHGQTMPLVHSIKLMVMNNKNIEVKQIDLDKDSVEDLQRMSKGYFGLFIDEFPADKKTLVSQDLKTKVKVLSDGKVKVWVAISNFDKVHEEDDVLDDIQTAFPGFKIIDEILNINMRNPRHVKEQVGKAMLHRKNELGEPIVNFKIAALNEKMTSPTNLLHGSPGDSDSQVVLRQVFIDKTMKAVIATNDSKDALMISSILSVAYQCPNVLLTKWSDGVNLQVAQWIHWNWMKNTPNVLVTEKKMMNGCDADVIISGIEGCLDCELGDVASRATYQFINFEELFTFLTQAKMFTIKDGCFEVSKSCQTITNFNVTEGGFMKKIRRQQKSEICRSGLQISPMDHIVGSLTDIIYKSFPETEDLWFTGSKKLKDSLFEAIIHMNLCIQLISSCPESKIVKEINLCNRDQHNKYFFCMKRLQLTYSMTDKFILMASHKDSNGQSRTLKSCQDLSGYIIEIAKSDDFIYKIDFKSTENATKTSNEGCEKDEFLVSLKRTISRKSTSKKKRRSQFSKYFSKYFK